MKHVKTSAVVVGAGVILAACGSTATAISSPSTSVASATSSSAANATGRLGNRAAIPGTSGTIASVTGTTLEVQNPTTGQTTVTYSSSTVLTKTIASTASAVIAGVCVNALGTPTATGSSTSTSFFGRPVTATTVTVSQPVNGSCTSAAGAGGFGGRRFPGGAGGGVPANGATGPARFPGAAKFATASGIVTSVANGVAEVSATNRASGSTVSIPVTLTSATTYLQNTTATATDLVVGQCARAVGTMNSIGAVAATRISISAPTANGCTTRGRFGFGATSGGTLG